MIKKNIFVYVKAKKSKLVKKRDYKGVYEKAITGEIKNFTGISDIYEEPQNAEIVVDTDKLSIEEAANKIINYIKKRLSEMTPNVFYQQTILTQKDRAIKLNQNPCVLWFTGLSGSGNLNIANALELELFKINALTYLLDGDNIRLGLNNDLGFNSTHRTENIRRIGEVSKLFIDAGIIVLVASISPFQNDRNKIRNLVGAKEFIEIYVDTPLEVCEKRDSKGLYKKSSKW